MPTEAKKPNNDAKERSPEEERASKHQRLHSPEKLSPQTSATPSPTLNTPAMAPEPAPVSPLVSPVAAVTSHEANKAAPAKTPSPQPAQPVQQRQSTPPTPLVQAQPPQVPQMTPTAATFALPQQPRAEKTFTVNGKPFTRIAEIGRGGSSKVFQVISAEGKIFALKRVRLDKSDPITIEGYINEINLLNQFKDAEAIVKLFDSEVNTEQGYLHMVLCFFFLFFFVFSRLPAHVPPILIAAYGMR